MIDIEELKPQIVQALMPLKPDKIILFGSYAYGNPTEDSDIDICVVKKDYDNKWQEKAKIRKLLINIDAPKDILNPRADEFKFYKKEINSVYCDINNKGDILWQRNS